MQITRGKIQSAQKVVVYGPEGIGKSTFASKFPDPIFIDTEGSTKHMDVARMPKPSSWTMLMEQVKHIKANPTLCRTLVIDTADWAEQLCISSVCATADKKGIEDFGYGKGYIYLAEEFGRFLNVLEDVIEQGVNVTVSAHAKMRKFEQPDEMGAYDRWELKLQKQTAALLKEWADMVLFANYKTYVINVDGQGVEKGKNKVQGGKRVMYTTHNPCWDAKNRHGLKDELPFDYAEIAHCLIHEDKAGATVKVEVAVPPAPSAFPKSEVVEFKETNEPTPFDKSPDTKGDPPAEQLPIGEPRNAVGQDQPPVKPGPEIPKPLADLMITNNVYACEIQRVVAEKGYYPEDAPIENYDTAFIDGVLVGAWGQVFKAVLENRKLPF